MLKRNVTPLLGDFGGRVEIFSFYIEPSFPFNAPLSLYLLYSFLFFHFKGVHARLQSQEPAISAWEYNSLKSYEFLVSGVWWRKFEEGKTRFEVDKFYFFVLVVKFARFSQRPKVSWTTTWEAKNMPRIWKLWATAILIEAFVVGNQSRSRDLSTNYNIFLTPN